MQAYSRQLKALAEDYAPLGTDLPEILRKGEEAFLAEASHLQPQD